MNIKVKVILNNLSYTVLSNVISLLISILVVLVVPKVIGVEAYGYWQLYMFYATYVGFFQFGWNDGIYLRYGGKEYNELNKSIFFSQFWMLTISQLALASIIIFVTLNFINEEEKIYILGMTALCMVIAGTRAMLLFILQGTNRIKEYAQITMMDRIFYICLIVIFLIIGIREYKLMILADIIGKSVSLIYAMCCCKDIVFRKITTFYFSFKEAFENINVGIKLMFANIASMLIIGVVRFGIEHSWDVATFGRVSLTLSISNFLMLFINAVGIVMFPILRRTDEKKLPGIYCTMRDFLMIALFGVLIVYYPFKEILSAWLPKYADSLAYMAILFPMCIYEGKMSLLINTYLKTLRKEKMMLKVNLVTLAFSIIITIITTIVFRNLDLAILSIVLFLAFRCILAEIYLSRILEISMAVDIVLELIMVAIFIMSGWYVNSWMTVAIYMVAYIIYLFIKRKDISGTIKNIKTLTQT